MNQGSVVRKIHRSWLWGTLSLLAMALMITGCPPPAEVIVGLSPATSSIEVAATVTLNATSTDATDTFSWTTSDSAIASVSASGASATVTGVTVGQATITVTGSNSAKTDTATVTVTAVEVPGPTLLGLEADKPTILPFTVQVAYNDDTVFFHMNWEGDRGDTHDYYHFTDGAWQREIGPRREAQATLDNDPLRGPTDLTSTIYESRASFMLDDPSGPNAVPMFKEMGCMLACHDNSRHMPGWLPTDGEVHKYLPDDEMFNGSRLDMWQHRLARANPIGFSDDSWIGQRINGEDDGDGGSRHSDAGTGPYENGTLIDGSPQWIFDPGTTPNGEFAFKFEDLFVSPLRFFTDATAQFLGSSAPNPVGINYADAVALGYVPSEGDTVPRIRLRQATDSRADITAAGTTFTPSADNPIFGRWDSNLQRALVTGNADDTDLADGGVYNIAFAVHTGQVTVRDHYVSFSLSLSLNGGAGDIQAVKIAGSGRAARPDFANTEVFPVSALNLFLPGITSDEFLLNENTGLEYVDPETNAPVDQSHGGANALLTQGLSCRDCHTAAADETFAPVNAGGFDAGAMEELVLQRGGVNTPTPRPVP